MLRRFVLSAVVMGLLVQFPGAMMSLTHAHELGEQQSADINSEMPTVVVGDIENNTPCHKDEDLSNATKVRDPCDLVCKCSTACAAQCSSVHATASWPSVSISEIPLSETVHSLNDTRCLSGFPVPIYHPPQLS